MTTLTDFAERRLRLTQERLEHIERRPELEGQCSKIEKTLTDPDDVRVSDQDKTVYLYHRRYQNTPVTEK